MKTLKQATVGETVKVVKLHGEGAIKRRIMDMGLTKGVEVYVRKVTRPRNGRGRILSAFQQFDQVINLNG